MHCARSARPKKSEPFSNAVVLADSIVGEDGLKTAESTITALAGGEAVAITKS